MRTLLTSLRLSVVSLAVCGGFVAVALDMETVELFATHSGASLRFLVDGDAATEWGTDGSDLTRSPVNVFVRLPRPAVLSRLEVLTSDKKGFIRLTRLEVHARVDTGWAHIGGFAGNDQMRVDVRLLPVEVSLLRLRVMDTARPDHAFAVVRELRLHPATDDVVAVRVESAAVGGESESERLFVDAACGLIPIPPPVVFDPEKGYLHYARSFVDTMLRAGTDVYGETHSPMFTSILLLGSGRHPGTPLPNIVGQRQHDRAPFGGNLQHDLPLLLAMPYLSDLTGDGRYRAGADAYLRFFLEHCTDTPTGLWPWGEHAHWDFHEEAPGHTIHEHLGAPPLSFWETAWRMNPKAVIGEADGCINHVVNLETFAYNRHADIRKPLPDPRLPDSSYLDFPRHGGFYMQTWAFAYAKTGRATYLEWIERMLDHQQRTRLQESGLLPSTSTRDDAGPSLGSTLSCAVSLLESVPLLGVTATAMRVETIARDYLEAVARAVRIPARPPEFTAHYGSGVAAGGAMLQGYAYRLTGDERFLLAAAATARHYAAAGLVPDEPHVPAQVFGSIINLMLDMHDLGVAGEWVAAAESYARQAVEALYGDGLFRGATGLWSYESELWVSNLVYALVRLHATVTAAPVTVPPLTFQR